MTDQQAHHVRAEYVDEHFTTLGTISLTLDGVALLDTNARDLLGDKRIFANDGETELFAADGERFILALAASYRTPYLFVRLVENDQLTLANQASGSQRRGRYRGCLLGLATGDAIGTTVEFAPPGSFTPVTDMTGGGQFSLLPGQWTDDTTMALCLAESLIERQGFDSLDQLERYLRWYRDGHLSCTGTCFDIGGTTAQALSRFARTHEPYPGSTDARSAGNGSIMRLAPVPLAFANRPAEAIARSAESSRTTHGAATAIDACRYLGAILVGAINGESKEELLASRYTPVVGSWEKQPLTPEIDAVAAGSFKERQPPAIRGRGYVVASLEAALWAFYRSDTFAEGCLLAVNLGEDADTTAAVYGQIAGAFYGEDAIPTPWRTQLACHDTIVGYAEGLWQLSDMLR